MSTTPVLAAEGINTFYGRSHILRNVSFHVNAGETVTLLGRNGMGKTTTVRSIMGLVPARAGQIEFMGEAIAGLAPEQIARRGIGLVPEGRQVFPNLTVHENLWRRLRTGSGWPVPGRWSGSMRCFRAWPRAVPRWPTRCRAARRKCWRWAGR